MPTEGSDSGRGFRGDQPATLKDVRALLVLLAIAGVLCVGYRILVSNLDHDHAGARIHATESSIAALSAAVQRYQRDCGQWPTCSGGLMVLCENADDVSGWKGPYVRGGGWLNDSWGNPLKLVSGTQDCIIVSAGPDCEFDTRDDLKGVILIDKEENAK